MRSRIAVALCTDAASVPTWSAISWFTASSKVLYVLQSAGRAKVIPTVGALTLA